MNSRIKKKILAVEMVFILLVSGFVGYVYISKQSVYGGGSENENPIQDTIKTTDETQQFPSTLIQAGPTQGYGPLAVHFYGNPKNDTDIVSYRWDFGPTSAPIVSQANYTKIKNLPGSNIAGLLFLTTFLASFLSVTMIALSFISIILLAILELLNNKYYNTQVKTNSQYQSTDRNPTMVFLNVGSYSATLKVTDTQGKTASETVWITVLQYVPPFHDYD